jgi:hypothetical protein
MAKKTSDGEPRSARPKRGEIAPPLLSEELIEKLQAAVNAAQRKRQTRADVTHEQRENIVQDSLYPGTAPRSA